MVDLSDCEEAQGCRRARACASRRERSGDKCVDRRMEMDGWR